MRALDRGRMHTIRTGARIVATAVLLRLIWVMVLHPDRYENPTHIGYNRSYRLPAEKGDLLDRQGRPLAHSVDAVALVCNPQRVADPEGVARLLAPLVGQPPEALVKPLSRRWRRQMLRRHISPELEAQLAGLAQAGVLTFKDEPGDASYGLYVFPKQFQPSPGERTQLAVILGVHPQDLAPLMATEAGAVRVRDRLDETTAKRVAQLGLDGVLVQQNPRPMVRCCWLEPVPAAIVEQVDGGGRRTVRIRPEIWAALAPLWAGVDPPQQGVVEARLPGVFVYVARELPLELVPRLQALLDSKPELAGLSLHPEWMREYPQGDTGRQLLGRCDSDEQGLTGLEAMFNQVLSGVDGLRRVTVSALGRPIMQERQELIPAAHGKNVELTLDVVVQGYAEEAVAQAVVDNDADWGLAVVADPLSGEVLALADAASKTRHISAMTRCLATAYEPGSIMKPLVVGSALDEGVVRATDTVVCHGQTVVGGRTLTCIKVHGPETVADAVRDSCNMVLVNVGQKMGQARLEKHFRNLGLFSRTGLGLAGQESVGGIFTGNDTGRWSLQKVSTVSYGKGIECTAVELIRAYGALVNGGTLRPLTMVRRIRDREGAVVVSQPDEPGPRVFSEETCAKVRAMMRQVVVDKRGTGHLAESQLYDMCAKTGTSIAVRPGEPRVVSFVTFAPADHPRLLVLVSVAEPCIGQRWGSTTCGPAAKAIIEKGLLYFGVPPNAKAADAGQTGAQAGQTADGQQPGGKTKR